MNISYNWLKEYVKFDLAPAEVEKILTSIGLEVEHFEEVEEIPGGLAGVVVAEVRNGKAGFGTPWRIPTPRCSSTLNAC